MSKRILLLLAVVLTLGLVVAACGGDDDETGAETVAAEVEEAQEAADEAGEAAAEAVAEAADIVDTAVATDTLSTLVTAVTAAELAETLKGPGPFTVFAPTNDAFAALPEGTLDDLLLEENKAALAGVLTYHVVEGKVLSSDLANSDVVTVNGESVTIVVDDGVTVNGANVIQADIETSNGVVHVIDAVLLPSS